MEDLKDLSAQWLAAKADEKAANARRAEIEDKIVALTGKRDEGSKTHDIGDFKIVVTGKLSYKMDWKAWDQVKAEIPAELHPVKMKPEVDAKGITWLRENQPDLYALIPVEIKPAKTGIEIEAVVAK